MKLSDPLAKLFRTTDVQKKALERLGLSTVQDLFYYFPNRYGDFSKLSYIQTIQKGDTPIIYAEVTKISMKKAYRTGVAMTEATLEDSNGDTIKAVWYSQPYIAKMLPVGTQAKFVGAVSERAGSPYLTNPEYYVEKDGIPVSKTGPLLAEESQELVLYPVYKETKGITSKWLYHKIKKLVADGYLDLFEETIPENILKKYKLPGLQHALIYIHSPKRTEDAEAARKRFAFEEVFLIQLVKQSQRQAYKESGSFVVDPDKKKLAKFEDSLGFTLTNGQKKAVASIFSDLGSETPMSRLLEGDVGSGKTIVAAYAAYATAITRPKDQTFGSLQVGYMAPTEILAKQIFNDFVELFGPFGITVGLITGKTCLKYPSKTSDGPTKISKAQLKKWVANGEVKILVGTHALISKGVLFENLGMVVIDEQHRFGKKQRAALRAKPTEKKAAIKKSKIIKKGLADNDEILPHLLSMTATPIPRTLALTIYGDLDLTVLDEMPPGRKKVITELVDPIQESREDAYEKIRERLAEGRQMYVICPRIFEADPLKTKSLLVKSAVAEAKRLKRDVFPDYRIGVLHSKMKKEEKEEVMQQFTDHKIDILVSTTVVEVGVNVPNATNIIIEGAERYGLSQLHQLRGRVIRSTYQPYCYLFADVKSEKTKERLDALTTAKNGFELAEYDLQFRGTGEMMGNKQSGVSDLAMEAIRNIKLVEAAREEAKNIVESNTLSDYSSLQSRFDNIQETMYLE